MSEGSLQRWWRRVSATDAERHDEQRKAESERSHCQQVSCVGARDSVVLLGELSSVSVDPPTDSRRLEATLSDGTGDVTLVWMGRRTIPGITAGRKVKVRGRLAADRNRLVLFNPYYELQS